MHRRLVALALTVALTGCATTATSPEVQAQLLSAEAQLASGENREAADALLTLAQTSRGDTQQRARLGAARALFANGDTAGARAQWQATRRERLAPDLQFEHDLLGARLALADGRPAEAVAALQQAPEAVPAARREAWLQLRADALGANRDPIGAAAALAALAAERSGADRARTLRQAERALADASDSLLQQQAGFLPDDHPLLPLLSREMGRRGLAFDRPLARPAATATRPPRSADGYHPPARVAVLLPLSGELAPAGEAVRDGLLAGYHAETRARPPVRFYDTAGTVAGARRARQQAMTEGADFLIGPLGREEVAALAAEPVNDVGWLALNRLPAMAPGSASFALAPEDDGALVAQRLVGRAIRDVLVLAQAGEGPQRTLQGFREAFEAEGGRIVGTLAVDAQGVPQGGDLAALGAQAGPAQALVLALQAPAARLLLPQLDGAGLGALPRIASAQILTGANPRLDRELDGVEFPDLPWSLGDAIGLPDADAVGRQLPSARGPAARLFAFGFDAWRITAYLDHLQASARTLRGATGELAVDASGTVQRTPAWAVFANGQPQPWREGLPPPATPEAPPAQ